MSSLTSSITSNCWSGLSEFSLENTIDTVFPTYQYIPINIKHHFLNDGNNNNNRWSKPLKLLTRNCNPVAFVNTSFILMVRMSFADGDANPAQTCIYIIMHASSAGTNYYIKLMIPSICSVTEFSFCLIASSSSWTDKRIIILCNANKLQIWTYHDRQFVSACATG